LYDAGRVLREIYVGKIDGIGSPQGNLTVSFSDATENFIRPVALPDYASAFSLLTEWLDNGFDHKNIGAIGHRFVHGGPHYFTPQLITPEMLNAISALGFLDPEHLPKEIRVA